MRFVNVHETPSLVRTGGHEMRIAGDGNAIGEDNLAYADVAFADDLSHNPALSSDCSTKILTGGLGGDDDNLLSDPNLICRFQCLSLLGVDPSFI